MIHWKIKYPRLHEGDACFIILAFLLWTKLPIMRPQQMERTSIRIASFLDHSGMTYTFRGRGRGQVRTNHGSSHS
ncbi:hypothetical protein BDV26DRAFT_255847 [Aspergillus bertholletiae]|uniref:Uncharacterized protein n=1 Tax=Aspergillus bertholletiae TaxID=1226010 RepID=A0A5N7BHB3_9EURO|nr:hypothetical protein BDV26DRAFT_255847 [Aspergillus bertholletiae]